MPYKDKVQQREYQQEWARRKRAGENTKIVNKPKPTEEEIKIKRREYNKRYRENLKRKIDNLLGTKCVICGEKRKRMVAHEIYGNSHEGGGVKMKLDVIKRPEDFRRLCSVCHKGVHWVMEFFNMTWEEILEKLK